jgi:hypothetical protein
MKNREHPATLQRSKALENSAITGVAQVWHSYRLSLAALVPSHLDCVAAAPAHTGFIDLLQKSQQCL